MTKPIHILMLVDSMRGGGKERRLFELVRRLARNDQFDISVVVLSEEIHYDEITRYATHFHIFRRAHRKDPGVLLKLVRLCRGSRPAIIHAWDSMSAVYAAATARLCGIKFVNGMICDAPPRLAPFGPSNVRARLTFPWSDVVLANSLAGLNRYRAPENRARCIKNGFDFRRLDHLEDRAVVAARVAPAGYSIVGMVGSFTAEKDHRTFIESAKIVLAANEKTVFLTVGDGPLMPAAQAALPPSLKSRFLFMGQQKDVDSIINALDVGVLATFGEGIPNSVLEMMALGKPVVVTRAGGTPELVVDGLTGVLVPPEDPISMAHGIQHLLDDPVIARSLGEAGRQRVKDHFSIDRMLNEFEDLYREVAQSR